MRISTSLMIGFITAVNATLSSAGETTSFEQCLALAPKGEQFSISLTLAVDTSQAPISKHGNLGVSNDAGPEVADEQAQKFRPMIECLSSLVDS